LSWADSYHYIRLRNLQRILVYRNHSMRRQLDDAPQKPERTKHR
jgi:hypothetical protein